LTFKEVYPESRQWIHWMGSATHIATRLSSVLRFGKLKEILPVEHFTFLLISSIVIFPLDE